MKQNKLIKNIINLTSNYNYIYITSDLRGFIYNSSIEDYSHFFENLFKELNNKNITTIIPSYTYTEKGKFEVYRTKSNLSILTKWSFEQKKFTRSSHPLFSCIGIGNNKSILNNIGKSAFGKNSIFDKLNNENSCLLHLGRPLELGNTVIHYVEQLVGSTYRVNKRFYTKVYNRNRYLGNDYTAYVRNIIKNKNDYISNTLKICKILKSKNFVKEIGNYKNNTNITVLDYKKSIDLMVNEFYKNQNIFIN